MNPLSAATADVYVSIVPFTKEANARRFVTYTRFFAMCCAFSAS